ncbi:tRNA pseudouridine synthase A [Exiguobacterium indicum]|uniref:tRNA pseudouridine synthase A n=1 Tax=Exiguobacterium indicum TaxID=296995 RepID=A0AAW3MA38_9BACL|nr:tRNA pseudouridine(38-40) synthase TruA [Exiguobacterium indicum]KTR25594.1 tRNA pseudouridine synthase A [Exiguobacterium indicum]
MRRLKCTIQYDGTGYAGYQVQPNGLTIQEVIETTLARMHKHPVKIIGSGRTDAKVHAYGQVIHFDTELAIPPENVVKALNTLLPADIRVRSCEEVEPTFEARYDVVGKEYRYFVRREENAFRRNLSVHIPYPLDLERIRQGMAHLVGTHDFSSFCVAKTETDNRVRTIYESELMTIDDELVFRFQGSGFLYNQIRIMVGTLLDVGRGRFAPEDIKKMLLAKDRNVAGVTAPPHGLYLWEVFYPE